MKGPVDCGIDLELVTSVKDRKMEDLISIILPVYNGEKYLHQSISSVLAQTYKNWELLIIDDCSTDSTAQIAAEFMAVDSRVKYFRNERNLRLPRNLNRGFSLANGQCLTWTSDDNLYHPEALAVMLNALKEKPEAQFVFCNYDIVDEEGRTISTYTIPSNYEMQIVGNNVVGACFLYTKKVYETVGDYQHGRILAEDFDYWQRVFAEFPVVAINQSLYQYRRHPQSLTGSTAEKRILTAHKATIVNNRALFGKLSLAQRYYYYQALYSCDQALGINTSKKKYAYYRMVYEFPKRLKRKLLKK